MYTWGYIKAAALAKLDISENEARTQGMLTKFHFYANEAMTQICSSVKPKASYFAVTIYSDLDAAALELGVNSDMYKEVVDKHLYVNGTVELPDDFVSYGNNLDIEIVDGKNQELHDTDYAYTSYKTIMFFKPGAFLISYNARWYTFTSSLRDDEILNIPLDILECIPSYIASQSDDEVKASMFRNEYELFVARINDSSRNRTGTIVITGGW